MKSLLNGALKLLVSLALIFYLSGQVDMGGLEAVFKRLSPAWLVAAVVFFFISNVLGAVQWYLLLQAQDLAVRFRQALGLYLVGVFFNNVLLGNIGGDAVRVYDIKRLTGRASGGLAATFMDRFFGLFSLCTLALAAYPLIARDQRAWVISLLWPVWLGLLGLLALGLSRRLGQLFQTASGWLLPVRVATWVRGLQENIGIYRDHGGLLTGVFAIGLGVQFSRILVYWSAGMAVGLAAELIHFICFQPVAAILAALPISIGGLGVRENTLVGLFGGVGVAQETATAMSLLGYSAGIIASLAGAVIFVARRIERAGSAGEGN
ncbi:MAG: flippase-like domain-containing protein [Candidatus Latescibacteria bacterium]|nr:flippase-like domain-containing protein [Candidatus Latescibacterota bacterium]